MRKIETKLYKFSELSDEAKERAIEQMRTNQIQMGNPYYYEIHDSMIAFKNSLPNPPENELLTGFRLRKWVINNYYPEIEKGKYYSTSGRWVNGKHLYRSRMSNLQNEISCPFTGVCYDQDFLQPIFDFVNDPNECDTWIDLTGNAEDIAEQLNERECDRITSDEYLQEEAEANEIEFTEDGTIY